MIPNTQPITVEYERLERPDSNVVRFPEGCDNVSQQPKRNVSYTSQQLAEVAGVSRQSWGKDWFKHFTKVVPAIELKVGRQYTQLCRDMTASLATARALGTSSAQWLTQTAQPKWGRSEAEAVAATVEHAKSSGAIVPAASESAADSVLSSLTLATTTAATAEALLDEVFGSLDEVRAQRQTQRRQIDIKRIIAEETIAIAEEERIREEVRAGIIARRQAAADAALQQQMDEFRGGAS